jgi:tetrahydromethanopterin S-methyltransferase subunit G
MKKIPSAKKQMTVNELSNRLDSVEHRLDKKIDDMGERLDKKIDSVAGFMLQKFDQIDKRFDQVATKADINRIMNFIDHSVNQVRNFEMEQGSQSIQIKELREKSNNHELRIANLEAAQ